MDTKRHAKEGTTQKEARPPTVFSTAIEASFKADASVREALTENLGV